MGAVSALSGCCKSFDQAAMLIGCFIVDIASVVIGDAVVADVLITDARSPMH